MTGALLFAATWIGCSSPAPSQPRKGLAVAVKEPSPLAVGTPFTVIATATDESGNPGSGEVRFRMDHGTFGDPRGSVRDILIPLVGGVATVTGVCAAPCPTKVPLVATWEGEVVNRSLIFGGEDGGAVSDAGVEEARFRPGSIVLAGTLEPGQVAREVLCDLTTPNIAFGGYDTSMAISGPPQRPVIHPLDGYIYYLAEGVLRRFQADKVYVNTSAGAYPLTGMANDPIVPTPCPDGGLTSGFWVRPDGAIFHSCRLSSQLLDSSGQPVASCAGDRDVEELSEAASYCRTSGNPAVFSDAGLFSVPNGDILFVVRNKPDGGFWGVARGANSRFERWTIALDGGMTLDGEYAAAPPDFLAFNADAPGSGNIDREGNFYRWGGLYPTDGGLPGFSDLVARFSADLSSSSIVYDDASPTTVCRFHGSSLITGP